jgi:hypothetical protein
MFGCLMAYCHLLHSGLTRPILLKSPSLIRYAGPCFVLVLESAESDAEESSHERKDALFDMAAHVIKNLFQRGAKLDNVFLSVRAKWPSEEPTDRFICNIPISIPTTISAGVFHFECR